MILDDDVYKDLDEFMEAGRRLGDKHPELQDKLIIFLFVLFKAYYAERGIDSSGRKFKDKGEKNEASPARWF